MTVGGEEVLSERELLAGVEDGLMMDSTDSVRYIILHCSATRCDRGAALARPSCPRLPHHRLSLLRPPRRNRQPAPPPARGGRPLPSLQPVLHRRVLRGRTGCRRASRRHAHPGTDRPAGTSVAETAENFSESTAQRASRHAGKCAQSMSLSRLPRRVPSHSLKAAAPCMSLPVRLYIPAFSRDAAFFCTWPPYIPVSDGRLS